ncbi:hypothetical protein R3P38DRAFT_2806592 [Favolaschia claudopus]|uniref:Uncharacterized protein n=1 Tax=Favolaschia claudopus TaxID=2862362 RepID=A0AAV9ZJR2_9AGAR
MHRQRGEGARCKTQQHVRRAQESNEVVESSTNWIFKSPFALKHLESSKRLNFQKLGPNLAKQRCERTSVVGDVRVNDKSKMWRLKKGRVIGAESRRTRILIISFSLPQYALFPTIWRPSEEAECQNSLRACFPEESARVLAAAQSDSRRTEIRVHRVVEKKSRGTETVNRDNHGSGQDDVYDDTAQSPPAAVDLSIFQFHISRAKQRKAINRRKQMEWCGIVKEGPCKRTRYDQDRMKTEKVAIESGAVVRMMRGREDQDTRSIWSQDTHETRSHMELPALEAEHDIDRGAHSCTDDFVFNLIPSPNGDDVPGAANGDEPRAAPHLRQFLARSFLITVTRLPPIGDSARPRFPSKHAWDSQHEIARVPIECRVSSRVVETAGISGTSFVSIFVLCQRGYRIPTRRGFVEKGQRRKQRTTVGTSASSRRPSFVPPCTIPLRREDDRRNATLLAEVVRKGIFEGYKRP